jgi:hypothetical protein
MRTLIRHRNAHLIAPIKWGKVRAYEPQTALSRYLPEISGKERHLSGV